MSSVFHLLFQILTSVKKEHTTALLMPSAVTPMDRSTAQVFNGHIYNVLESSQTAVMTIENSCREPVIDYCPIHEKQLMWVN